ncbi:MAG: class I SAM-dependent methyltransferase [Spirosomataceae bacterium]
MANVFSSIKRKPEQNKLRKSLDYFYSNVSDYTVFLQESNQIGCWSQFVTEVKQHISDKGFCNILEVGAGRSGFGKYLLQNGLKEQVFLMSQDVTNQNKEYLEEFGDEVFVGDVSEVNRKFDLIFSTYVLEHVVDPLSHLGNLVNLLEEDGDLCIFSPRYDLPFYLPPSTRHLGTLKRIEFSIKHVYSRIATFFTNKYQFLIHDDLACFHGPFFRDSDAVHWVSKMDITIFAKKMGLELHSYSLETKKILSKDWIVKRYLTVAVHLTKRK